jgi:3-isopropylmalate/(R)-2-methylmalate dehydratase small subunit
LLESPNILKRVQEGDVLIVDLDKGEIINKTEKYTIKAIKLPTFILEIVNDGGLIENLRKKLRNEV